jgi:hypothetical protein
MTPPIDPFFDPEKYPRTKKALAGYGKRFSGFL